jgi:hypothetical protein
MAVRIALALCSSLSCFVLPSALRCSKPEGRTGGGKVPQGVADTLEDDRASWVVGPEEGILQLSGVLPTECSCVLGLDQVPSFPSRIPSITSLMESASSG